MKRQLFSSKRDGTKFKEDVEYYLTNFKKWVNENIEITEPIIKALEYIEDAIQAGTKTDLVIRFILSNIKGQIDEQIYFFLQNNLHVIIEKIKGAVEDIGEMTEPEVESFKMKTASLLFQRYKADRGEDWSRIDSDTVIQLTVKSLAA